MFEKLQESYKALVAGLVTFASVITTAAADGGIDLSEWQAIVGALVAGAIAFAGVWKVTNKPAVEPVPVPPPPA